MKKTKRILALTLSVLMLFTTLAILPVSAEEEQTKWVYNNGEQVTWNPDATDSISRLVDNNGETEGNVLEYGYYAKDGTSTVEEKWSYTYGQTLNDPKYGSDGKHWYITDSTNTAYMMKNGMAYWTWAAYAMGTVFHAPYSGEVKFTFQLADYHLIDGKGTAVNATTKLYVARSDFKLNNTGDHGVLSSTDTYETAYQINQCSSLTDTYTVTVDVVANENIYFLIGATGGQYRVFFYMNSIEYTSIDATAAKSAGYSVTMGDSPVVNFYVDLTGNPGAVSAEVKIGDGASYVLSEAEVITGEALTNLGYKGTATTLYKYSVAVPAKQMTEDVSFVIKHSDGTVLVNDTYSVNEYCQAQVDAYEADTADTSKRDVALACTGILLYGRSAQAYFGYNTSNMPEINADLAKAVAGIA